MEQTLKKLRTTFPKSTFDLKMVRDTDKSRVVYVKNIKWIREIGMEPRTGHNDNFERPVWPQPLTFGRENGHAASI